MRRGSPITTLLAGMSFFALLLTLYFTVVLPMATQRSCIIGGRSVVHGGSATVNDPTFGWVTYSCANGNAVQQGAPQAPPAPAAPANVDCTNVPQLGGTGLGHGQSATSRDGKEMIACSNGVVTHVAWIAPTTQPVAMKDCIIGPNQAVPHGAPWNMPINGATTPVVCNDGKFNPTGMPAMAPTTSSRYVSPAGCDWGYFNPAWSTQYGTANIGDRYNPVPSVLWVCTADPNIPQGMLWIDPNP